MPTILFKPSGKTIAVAPGTPLLDVLSLSGLSIHTPCGAKGVCGKCVVRVPEGGLAVSGTGLLTKESIGRGYVLACRARCTERDAVVEIPEQESLRMSRFLDSAGQLDRVDPSLLPRTPPFSPLAQRYFHTIPLPAENDGLSDLDRVCKVAAAAVGEKTVVTHVPVLRKIADAVRLENGAVTVHMVKEADRFEIIDILPGTDTRKQYGVAVDVGTTTVSLYLVDLESGSIDAAGSEYNGQIACGLDIINRINYGQTPQRLRELSVLVLETINTLIAAALRRVSAPPESITNAALSGNTVMMHLLLGCTGHYLRLQPYIPCFYGQPVFTAQETGLHIHPFAPVYLSPHVGAYVGGDITAGLLCTPFAQKSKELLLYVDIGTNGEIALGNDDFILTCACSAGPAFEGGGIESGMRAAAGAIDFLTVDGGTGGAEYTVIGNEKPKGICGSGLICLVAELLKTNFLDQSGRFDDSKESPFILKEGRRRMFVVVPESRTATGTAIVLSERDIENILRTKASLYAACELLLKQAGRSWNDIVSIYIAGGFGYSLHPEQAITIGLLPDIDRKKFIFLGNASLMGTYMCLLSEQHRIRQHELSGRMTYLELNADPGYMEHYTAALFFPHTDRTRFPSIWGRRREI